MENALITTREKFNGLSSAIVLQFHLSLGGDGCFEPVYIRDVSRKSPLFHYETFNQLGLRNSSSLDRFRSEQTYSDLVTKEIKNSVGIDHFFNVYVRIYLSASCEATIFEKVCCHLRMTYSGASRLHNPVVNPKLNDLSRNSRLCSRMCKPTMPAEIVATASRDAKLSNLFLRREIEGDREESLRRERRSARVE